MDKLINEDQKVPEITERTNYDSRGRTFIKLKLKNNSKVWFKVFKKKGKGTFFSGYSLEDTQQGFAVLCCRKSLRCLDKGDRLS